MTTRVARKNELRINGVAYKVYGDITLSRATWPLKTLTGDYNEDTQPNLSNHSWHDQRGGIGVDRWKGPEDDDKAWYSECWLRNRNHLLLPPLATVTATAGSETAGPYAIGSIGGKLLATFGAGDSSIYSTTDDGVNWTDTTTNTSGIGHRVASGSAGGDDYIVFCGAGGASYQHATGISIVTSRTYSTIAVAFWDDRLWGMNTSGQLWYTHTPGSEEVLDARLPNNVTAGTLAYNEVSLFVGPSPTGDNVLYVATAEGLWAHDAGNQKFHRINIEYTSIAGIVCGAVLNGKIYIGAGSSVIEYDPLAGTLRDIGLDVDDGLPIDNFLNAWVIASNGRNLYLTGDPRTGGGTDRRAIYEWDGIGWQVLYAEASSTTYQVLTPLRTSNTRRLWFGPETGEARYINIRDSGYNPKGISGYTYASSAIHKYPWFDAGQNEVTKTLISVAVVTQDCDANDTVLVQYALDYSEGSSDASYVTLGTITSNGRTVYTLASGAGIDFSAVRIKLTLSGGASTTSPDVESVTLSYRKKLPDKYIISAVLDLSAPYMGKSIRTLHANLLSAIETSTAIEVTYRTDTGGSRNYYCDINQVAFKENSGKRETGLVQITATEL